jgi:hypothetical protein
MASILIGTSSWTDKTLIESGLFYPPEKTTSEARLRYYIATIFSISAASVTLCSRSSPVLSMGN